MRNKYSLKSLVLFFFLTTACLSAFSQAAKSKSKTKSKEVVIVPKTDSDTKKLAANNFKVGNYSGALGPYLSLQKGDSNSIEFKYRVALCYINMNADKGKAIPFLESIASKKDAPKDTYYNLGKAYHYAERFDEAIVAYQKYLGQIGNKSELKAELNHQIEMANNGKDLVAHPIDVTFENLGPLINTKNADYNPFISSDESILVFSTRRPGAGAADDVGVFSSDIFVSTMKDNIWTKAKSIGPGVNTASDEEALGLTSDGKKLLIYTNESEEAIGDIFYSTLKGKTWSKPLPFSKTINSPDLETGATLSPDGSTLYFSSDRKEHGLGGKDIYKSMSLPDGGWSEPMNLGPTVNTAFDEDAPYMHVDGHTLYFSSKGHNSMGGFDVFKTVYDDNTQSWSAPVNVGYPINNADDNLYFSLSVQGKYAYICAVRPEGLGDLDIYKVNFKEIQRNSYSTIIKGQLSIDDSTAAMDAKITYMNQKEPDDFGQYTPTSKGKFVISSKPGKFTLIIDVAGYATYREDIVIPEILQPRFLEKDIKMVKKETSISK